MTHLVVPLLPAASHALTLYAPLSSVDAAEKNASDVVLIHLVKDGHEIISDSSQAFVITHEITSWWSREGGPSLFYVERLLRESQFLAPTGRVGWRNAPGRMTLDQPIVRR